MEEVGGQAVEEIGQDQFLFGDSLVVVGLGQEGVGGDSREDGQGKRGPGGRGKVAQADQRAGQQGDAPGPVERLDEVCGQQAAGDQDQQAPKGPEQIMEEIGEEFRHDNQRDSRISSLRA